MEETWTRYIVELKVLKFDETQIRFHNLYHWVLKKWIEWYFWLTKRNDRINFFADWKGLIRDCLYLGICTLTPKMSLKVQQHHQQQEQIYTRSFNTQNYCSISFWGRHVRKNYFRAACALAGFCCLKVPQKTRSSCQSAQLFR